MVVIMVFLAHEHLIEANDGGLVAAVTVVIMRAVVGVPTTTRELASLPLWATGLIHQSDSLFQGEDLLFSPAVIAAGYGFVWR
jgi:hypothetical protein